MITAAQLRAARALLGIDQRELAQRSSLSLPTIQRMEASEGVIRGNVDSLMKLVEALSAAGIELIAEGATSSAGGRGVRLKPRPRAQATNSDDDARTDHDPGAAMIAVALWSVAALLALAPAGVLLSTRPHGSIILYGGCLIATSTLCLTALSDLLYFPHLTPSATLPIGLPWLGAHFRLDALSAFFLVVVNLGGAAASLFALGYGRHEDSPAACCRSILPISLR